MEKTCFIDSEYKAQDVTIFDDIDATSFSWEFLSLYLTRFNIWDFFTIHKQGMGFTLCNHITKSIKIRNWVEKVAESSEYEEGQKKFEVRRVSRRFDFIVEVGTDNNNRVNFYQFKHYQMTTRKKSVEEEGVRCCEVILGYKSRVIIS